MSDMYPPNLPPPFQPPAEEPIKVPQVVRTAGYGALVFCAVLSLFSTVLLGGAWLAGDMPMIGVYWLLWGGGWTVFWFALAHGAKRKPTKEETP